MHAPAMRDHCFWFNLILAFVVFGTPGVAQVKYDPDDEVVEAMARRGVEFLENSMGERGSGEQLALVALTISEVSKRYDRLVPSDHPLIVRSIESIKTYIDAGGRSSMSGHNNIYYPALALILLCDVDDVAYERYIIKLLELIEGWQQSNGSFNYPFVAETDDSIGDISQTQYACLAFFVAKHHGFRVDPEKAKKTLEWLVANQVQQTWYYHTRDGRSASSSPRDKSFTLSRHCCGLGSTYLMSDLLQLNPRSRKGGTATSAAGRGGLPPSVSVYVKPKENATDDEKKVGPLVPFDGGKLANCKRQGNIWFADNFKIEIPDWNYYYLYALERYAFFREQAEGEVSEVPTWYDQGVEFLRGVQSENGGFPPGNAIETPVISTSLAVLFLVRSSEVLMLPSNTSLLKGALGFQENTRLTVKAGQISSREAIQGIEDVVNLLNDSSADEQLAVLAEAMDETIRKFTLNEKSRGETMAFLTGLVKDRNYYRRLIAVKLLAREQDMDHVPALLYALGDPDIRVAKEAHDGLRLISRKIDSFPLPAKPTLDDFAAVKKQWTKWYLEIRPTAELID